MVLIPVEIPENACVLRLRNHMVNDLPKELCDNLCHLARHQELSDMNRFAGYATDSKHVRLHCIRNKKDSQKSVLILQKDFKTIGSYVCESDAELLREWHNTVTSYGLSIRWTPVPVMTAENASDMGHALASAILFTVRGQRCRVM